MTITKLVLNGVDEQPTYLVPGILYAIGGSAPWCCVFACPCGCGAEVYCNLLQNVSPRWSLSSDDDGPTLAPSVLRVTRCKSHFFVKNGQVLWC